MAAEAAAEMEILQPMGKAEHHMEESEAGQIARCLQQLQEMDLVLAVAEAAHLNVRAGVE